MPSEYPGRPVGLRIVAALFGFVIGLWSLFVPKENSFGDTCNLAQEFTGGGDWCGRWGLSDWAPQILALIIAGCCLGYAFFEE
jgi:hypothetical protein